MKKTKFTLFFMILSFVMVKAETTIVLSKDTIVGKLFTYIDNDTTPILYDWMNKYDSRFFTQKGMVCTQPKGYIKDNNTDDYSNKYPRLRRLLGMTEFLWVSNDGNALFYWNNYPIYREDDLDKIISKRKESLVDKQHCYQTKEMFRSYYGNKVITSYRDSLIYYSQKDAKQIFNADTAYRFLIKLRSEDFYKRKYKSVEVIFLQKKDCGWVNLICFYTDKGKKKINKYRKQIEKVLKYKE